MRRYLEYLSDQIEAVLAGRHVPVRVTGGLVTPRWVRFELTTASEARVGDVANLEEELARRLGSRNCRVRGQDDAILVEVPRENPGQVRLLPLCCRLSSHVPPCTAVLGLEEEGVPLLLRLGSPQVAHALIAGMTGSGKTALARTMALSLAVLSRQAQVQLALIGAAFDDLAGLPHLLYGPATGADEAAALLQTLVSETERRGRPGETGAARVVVFIDELGSLLQAGGQAAEESLLRLLQGEGAGIHVVACTRCAKAASLGSLAKANFPVRLVGSVAGPEEAKVASGLRGTGAERLLGRGDFLLVTYGEMVRFQAAWASPEEIGPLTTMAKKGGESAAEETMPAAGARQFRHADADDHLLRLSDLFRQLPVETSPQYTAMLGTGRDGALLRVRLDDPEVSHLLVAGTDGAGKSNLLKAMALGLALLNRQAQLQLALIGAAFDDLGGLPHLVPLADVAALGDELHRRMWDGAVLPRLVVFVDDLDGLAEEELDRLSFVLDAGPDYGVHVVAATARPLPELTWAFPVRVVGAVEAAEEARQMVGVEVRSAEFLLGQGDFLLLARDKEPVRFQAAWVPAGEAARSVEEAKSRVAAARERV